MNTTFCSETSVSRRCSTETIYSIQGKETDFARDTSDTDASIFDTDAEIEFEPASDEEEDQAPVDEDTSASFTDGEIIKTKVLEVSVGDDGDLQLADSEQTDSQDSDSEIDLYDFWHCIKCRAENNVPFYRYCQKCFQVRKNFFPPRPKRKRKRGTTVTPELDAVPRTLSQDSGIQSVHSQELFNSQDATHGEGTSRDVDSSAEFTGRARKRRARSVDGGSKRTKLGSASGSGSDSGSGGNSESLTKSVSDPSVAIDEPLKMTKKVISDRIKQKLDKELCIVCDSEPKTGVFVHGHLAHICCCYKCAVKVWARARRCPVCNRRVSNVLRAVVL
nr:Mdm2-like [Bombyx mori]